MKNPFKKVLMATALCTTLAGCGGGGGAGGAVGQVENWVNNDLSTLSGASSNISTWNSIIQSFATINIFKHDKDYQNLRNGRGILNEMIDRLIMSVSNSNYNR